MTLYIVKLFDVKNEERIRWFDSEWVPILDENREELEELSEYSIDSDFLPVYLYISRPSRNTLFISSTTGAWKWYLLLKREGDKAEKLKEIGYEEFTSSLMTRWMGFARYYEEEIKGTLATILLRLTDDYELLRIISY